MRLPLTHAADAVRPALRDRDPRVQRVAVHGLGLWRDRGAVPALNELLASADPHVRRVAAEALGRIGDARAVPALARGGREAARSRRRARGDLRADRDR